MLVKIHSSYRDIVAICDENLKGKVFKQGKKILNVREDFYNGDIKTEQETAEIVKEMIKQDATFNIVGEKSVKIATELGVINRKSIQKIQNIPYILILL